MAAPDLPPATRFTADFEAALGGRTPLGLIALQTDETIEHEFRRLITEPEAALFVSRTPSAPSVSPETLAAMAETLTAAAALLPPTLPFAAIAYACTSGATEIGPDRVTALVQAGAQTSTVLNPLDALAGAAKALGVRRLALLTPYAPTVTERLAAALNARDLDVARIGTFDEPEEVRVARIDPRSVLEAATTLGRDPDIEAVAISCTNLRTLEILAEAEAALGKPVISSNQALAWALLRRAGIAGGLSPAGRLTQL